jgi:hypothetical protein
MIVPAATMWPAVWPKLPRTPFLDAEVCELLQPRLLSIIKRRQRLSFDGLLKCEILCRVLGISMEF